MYNMERREVARTRQVGSDLLHEKEETNKKKREPVKNAYTAKKL